MNENNQKIFYLEKNNLDKKRIKNLVQFILKNEKITSQIELNIIITNDEYLHKLNKKFRNIDSPTDVLSFSFDNEFPKIEAQILGEVYISFGTAKKNAKQHKVLLQSEIERLVIHGILHLIGYEHENNSGKIKMQTKTDFYLKNFME
ncbi:MAG: rRNA maturation RNase YbeY [Candidatus Cloacimonetes bacterium]|nr:rRNA maturation RNase YbeY [Candidatus Cloacimonadota bacterium]